MSVDFSKGSSNPEVGLIKDVAGKKRLVIAADQNQKTMDVAVDLLKGPSQEGSSQWFLSLSVLFGRLHPLKLSEAETVYVNIRSVAKKLGITNAQAKKIMKTPESLQQVAGLIHRGIIRSDDARTLLENNQGMDAIRDLAEVIELEPSKITEKTPSESIKRVCDLFEAFKKKCLQRALKGERTDTIAFLESKAMSAEKIPLEGSFMLLREGAKLSLMEYGKLIGRGGFGFVAEIRALEAKKTSKDQGSRSASEAVGIDENSSEASGVGEMIFTEASEGVAISGTNTDVSSVPATDDEISADGVAIEMPVQTSSVIKQAIKGGDGSIEKEFRILNKLNPKGSVEGIQLAPHVFVRINVSGLANSVPGYLAPCYRTDLFNHSFQNSEEVKIAFSQLQNGLKHLHRMGITHGDIKPENILVKDGRYDLADFGGVLERTELKKAINTFSRSEQTQNDEYLLLEKLLAPSTKEFLSMHYLDLVRKAVDVLGRKIAQADGPKSRAKIKEEFLTVFSNLSKARDFYALGLSMLDKIVPMRNRLNIMRGYSGEVHSSLLTGIEDYSKAVIKKLIELGFKQEEADKLTTQLRGMIEIMVPKKDSPLLGRLEALEKPFFSRACPHLV